MEKVLFCTQIPLVVLYSCNNNISTSNNDCGNTNCNHIGSRDLLQMPGNKEENNNNNKISSREKCQANTPDNSRLVTTQQTVNNANDEKKEENGRISNTINTAFLNNTTITVQEGGLKFENVHNTQTIPLNK